MTHWISDTFGLAGWLFADLLVALALLFTAAGGFGASVGPPFPTASPSGHGTARPAADSGVSPSPSATRDVRPSDAVSQTKLCRAIHVDRRRLLSSDAAIAEDESRHVREQVVQRFSEVDAMHAQIVQTFGTSPNRDVAERLARAVNRAIMSDPSLLDHLFESARTRSFIDIDADEGAIWIEVFLTQKPPASSDVGCPPYDDGTVRRREPWSVT